jgi:ADP-ribose pyrophosphatase YjhB (NUDIX family)
MKPAQQLALWADKLRDISALGLLFSQNFHDRENYTALQDLALEMSASAVNEPLEQIEPLRAPVFNRPTPIVVGDAAIIDAAGQILLIQRADNGKWAMPGGALMVGETPAAGVLREALEETGVHCQITALVGVYDSRLWDVPSRHHLYMFVFLCAPLADPPPAPPSHALETLGMGWFPAHALPADLDPGHIRRIPHAFRVWRGEAGAHFDPA